MPHFAFYWYFWQRRSSIAYITRWVHNKTVHKTEHNKFYININFIVESFWNFFGEQINEGYILEMLDGDMIHRTTKGFYYVTHVFFKQFDVEVLLQIYKGNWIKTSHNT